MAKVAFSLPSLAGLDDKLTQELRTLGVKDLRQMYDSLKRLDERHLSRLRHRRWAERIDRRLSGLVTTGGLWDIVQSAASANPMASICVGVLKGVILVTYPRHFP